LVLLLPLLLVVIKEEVERRLLEAIFMFYKEKMNLSLCPFSEVVAYSLVAHHIHPQ